MLNQLLPVLAAIAAIALLIWGLVALVGVVPWWGGWWWWGHAPAAPVINITTPATPAPAPAPAEPSDAALLAAIAAGYTILPDGSYLAPGTETETMVRAGRSRRPHTTLVVVSGGEGEEGQETPPASEGEQ